MTFQCTEERTKKCWGKGEFLTPPSPHHAGSYPTARKTLSGCFEIVYFDPTVFLYGFSIAALSWKKVCLNLLRYPLQIQEGLGEDLALCA